MCTVGPPGGPVFGSFNISFGGDGFQGTLDGASSPTSTPGVFDLNLVHTILGGTGRFIGATGMFVGSGTADPRVLPSRINLNFAAVPEPGT